MKHFEPDDGWCGRPCERCKKEITDKFWEYGWCEDCCESGTCVHGEQPHECNACMHESDLAFDQAREGSK
jgi:hypothetical protein